ncbi:MAG: hypothetical protein JNM79_14380 [Burkholderiales bacterium]|nr:hypothetical protein [Burkholderiales bacterium]
MSKTLRNLLFCTGIGFCLPAFAAPQVLYDINQTGNLPTEAGWLAGGFAFSSQTLTPQGAQVAPLLAGNSTLGGYANHTSVISLFPQLQVSNGPLVNALFPALDRNAGFALSLGFRIIEESHSGNPNRAGFSVILVGQDLKGIEIGFQNDRIFAQNDGVALFTAGENTVDPLFVGRAFAAHNRWDLNVQGTSYALVQGGTTILSGALRDYSSYSGFGQDAYRTPNFVFFGDNTTSARGAFLVDYAAITAVPEPAPFALFMAGVALIAGLRRARAA